MAVFRKDPFGRAWVLISPERGLVASDFGSLTDGPERSALSPVEARDRERPPVATKKPGQEIEGSDWSMRVIPHPAALLDSRSAGEEGGPLFRSAQPYGFQEIIVEHPDARMTLANMSRAHLVDVLRLYRERLELLGNRPHIRHVQITRSVGEAAGALYRHPHAQVLAVPVGSRWVDEEIAAAAGHHAQTGKCLFCEVLSRELELKERVLSHNESYVAIAPFASKAPFETWILPRTHGSAYAGVASNTLPQLADILQTVLQALNDALDHPPYNLLVHTLPVDGDASYHWHIEILPRLTNQAGFDWGTGYYINPTPPEDAVRFLREALALQEVQG